MTPTTFWIINWSQSLEDNILNNLKLRLDTNIFVAAQNENFIDVYEVYRTTDNEPIQKRWTASWTNETGLTLAEESKWQRRSDLGGIELTAAMEHVNLDN